VFFLLLNVSLSSLTHSLSLSSYYRYRSRFLAFSLSVRVPNEGVLGEGEVDGAVSGGEGRDLHSAHDDFLT